MIQSGTFWFVLFGSACLYWLLPQRMRLTFLGLTSFGYLLTLEPVGVSLLALWTVIFFYLAPQAFHDKKYGSLVLIGLILAKLSDLVWQKYAPSAHTWLGGDSPGLAIAVPLGISYYTFKLIHYAVEVARGNILDRSLKTFFCYIFLFPIFTAGPIERFDHFLSNGRPVFRAQDLAEGLTRIAHGLIKFFVFLPFLRPDILGAGLPASTDLFLLNLDGFSAWQVWTFLGITYLYAYVDFSAYSDIAIGASRVYGLRIMENFRFPILAVNISDFWRRWHMTLAAWCQSYVYLPVLGRTRTPYAAVYSTFIVMGLWHGATWGWLMWGLYHATGVALYMAWARRARRWQWWRDATKGRSRWLGLPVTFLFVSGSYAFSSMGGGALASISVFLAAFGIAIQE